MIDLHCHLLPGIDDGPASLEESIELARMATSNGITHAAVTPHVHPGRYENTAVTLADDLATFRSALADHDVSLELCLGGEIRLCPEIVPMMEQDLIPFLGEWQGKKVLLLELPHGQIPPGSENLVEWLLDRDILPMIAHPERNKAVMREVRKVDAFVELGCLFQLTAMSVAGDFGESAWLCSRKLLEMGVVTVIASDAHNAGHRPPELEPGRSAASEIVGEEESWELVLGRPKVITQSRFTEVA
jgi:protein-tyrosine phosphatase